MTQNRIEVLAPLEPGFDTILTDEALRFLTALHDRFARPRRSERMRTGASPGPDRACRTAASRSPARPIAR